MLERPKLKEQLINGFASRMAVAVRFLAKTFDPRKSRRAGIYRINRMMRFIVGANSFAHKAPNLPAGRQVGE
jgi:hypothetical protein